MLQNGKRSNSLAEKHISLQEFAKCSRPSMSPHASAFLSQCICSVPGKPKWECEQSIYGFFFSLLSWWQEGTLLIPAEVKNKSSGQRALNCGDSVCLFVFCWLQHRCHLIWWLVVMGNPGFSSRKRKKKAKIPSPCRSHYGKKFSPQLLLLERSLALRSLQKSTAGQLEIYCWAVGKGDSTPGSQFHWRNPQLESKAFCICI